MGLTAVPRILRSAFLWTKNWWQSGPSAIVWILSFGYAQDRLRGLRAQNDDSIGTAALIGGAFVAFGETLEGFGQAGDSGFFFL
jgi:hypothetical protein